MISILRKDLKILTINALDIKFFDVHDWSHFAISNIKFDKIVFSLVIGGALGNFYDRISYKAVPDFIDLHYNNFHWFTFNLADIFITVGIIMLLVKELFINEKN